MRKSVLTLAVLVFCAGAVYSAAVTESTSLPKIDMAAWHYEESDNVFWQTGISYAANPADADLQTMGFFVPGPYFTATDNGDGTYTCSVNKEGTAAGYTAQTAPMIIPVNTPGYSSMAAPSDYSSSMGYGSVSDYTSAGFVVLFAGARGRDAGAPAGVTDFKAAIRYTRYNADILPGDTESIFSLGMSGGGAQSALIGATGDSSLYLPYLRAIGAVESTTDHVKGSMCWCPITNLDMADEAYEWNLGNTRSGLDAEQQAYSDGMAEAFALYINSLGLEDENGRSLVLASGSTGIYQDGSYYDYLKEVIETSLNNFLQDTSFPYTVSSASGRGGRGPQTAGGFPGQTDRPGDSVSYEQLDQINRTQATAAVNLSGTYNTVEDYINVLNSAGEWVSYFPQTNTVKITDISSFTAALKPAAKGIAAFDSLDRSQGENTLFGYGDGNGAHFDPVLASLVSGTAYEAEFVQDLSRTDTLGNTVDTRVNMYNPMYFLMPFYSGYGSSHVADFWRIRTGINQSDTALCTEVNLALALEMENKDTDFAAVWGMGHTEAERTGSSTENFIQWVNHCMGNY